MKAQDLMKHMIIIKDCQLDKKEEAVELILDKLPAGYKKEILNFNDIIEMSENKLYQSAFLEDGVFLMSFRVENIKELVIGICIPKEPVPIDNKNTHFIAVLVTSSRHAEKYAKAVYAINKIAQENIQLKLLNSMKGRDNVLNMLISEAFAFGWEN